MKHVYIDAGQFPKKHTKLKTEKLGAFASLEIKAKIKLPVSQPLKSVLLSSQAQTSPVNIKTGSTPPKQVEVVKEKVVMVTNNEELQEQIDKLKEKQKSTID